MSITISERYSLARRTSAFLHYLHLDVVMPAVVFVLFLIGGWANNFVTIRSIASAMPKLAISTEAPSLPREGERAARPLTPAMTGALDYVAQRYRVSAEALLPVFEAAQSAARERRLDPLLLIAVISVESRFNPFSESPMGAQGLMQIIPRYHLDKVTNAAADQPFLDPVINVRVGARILEEAIRLQGGLVEGLQYYGGASNDDEQVYAGKVLAEKLRLEQAPRRRADAGA